MHELSIALSILDIAVEEAERYDEARVGTVYLRLGALSGVVKEALRSAYELASESCGMAGSRLVIEEIPITVHCPTCNGSRAIASVQDFRCLECGTPSSQVLTGRELEVTAVEIFNETRTPSGAGPQAGAQAE